MKLVRCRFYSLLPFSFFAILTIFGFGCGAENEEQIPANLDDPARCSIAELGEASDLFPPRESLPDNQFVVIKGISSPKSLVWRDSMSGTHYIVKVMGTNGLLFYTEALGPGQTPKVLSEFSGTLRLWKNLPDKDSSPLRKALLREWKIEIDPSTTYLLYGAQKPNGCSN